MMKIKSAFRKIKPVFNDCLLLIIGLAWFYWAMNNHVHAKILDTAFIATIGIIIFVYGLGNLLYMAFDKINQRFKKNE